MSSISVGHVDQYASDLPGMSGQHSDERSRREQGVERPVPTAVQRVRKAETRGRHELRT